MINLYLTKNNPKANIYLCVMLFLCLLVSGFALYQTLSFSFLQFVILCISLTISIIINKYQKKVPGTQSVFSAKDVVIIWGAIWIGVAGAVFLAASASLARFTKIPKSKRHLWLFTFFVNVISAFVSANAFYFALYYLEGFTGSAVANNSLSVNSLTVATISMAFAHFWLYSIFTSTYLSTVRTHNFAELWKKNFRWMSAFYFLGMSAAFGLHFIFIKFGLEFGLIVLPLVVFGHISYKIHLHRLAQKTKEIIEASRIHQATVEALATAIDARDQVGIGHVRRTQIYAVGIGKILNLSDDDLQALNTGALLHDIGKLAVPDNILNKPGRLTPAEREKTKIHPTVGSSILQEINFPYPVVPTVKHHHERWDGNGYPDGLKQREIPFTARILCVADAYDTLRGARPYRPALSRKEAKRILLEGKGTQFDPQLVEIFLANLRKLETEVEKQGLAYKRDGEETYQIENEAQNSYIEQIKRANREIFTLYELARVFSSSLNLQDTLSLFSKKISELIQFDTCIIYLLDPSNKTASATYVKGKNSKTLRNKQITLGEGATGYAMKNLQSVYQMNPALDFSFEHLDFMEDYSAMASLPLIAEEKLLGAVSLYSCELSNYGEEHMRLLETIARIASDAIAMALQHAESETRALTDPMTNLPNARSLQLQFEKEVARASRNGSIFQLLMLDLDGFKSVNDSFGHKVGDKMLKELAKIMQGELRDYDFLSRYAGDEFVAIIPETSKTAVQELSQRIENAIGEFKLDAGEGKFAKVGVSLGSSCYPTDGTTIDQIIIAADKRMYEVKAKRKLKENLTNQGPIPGNVNHSSEKIELTEENFIVDVDESHIISNAIN
jgi:diguanylate cyclase (GGDEF)-like protein/putative nucleotidyltransferase with HDIG domain